MKYLSPKYWFELWLWAAPLFNSLLSDVSGKPINNMENTKDENNKNISKRDLVTDHNNEKFTTCVHEAGHTMIVLNSKFKDKFKKIEFLPKNNTHYGVTSYDQIFDLNKIKNITNSDLLTLLHIDLGGFAAESLVFNINFFTNIIDEGRINISSDLQNYHHIYQKEFEVRNLKLSNEENSEFIVKQMNETIKIIKNNKLTFEPIVKTCCLINYVNKLHADYILKYQALPIHLFTTTEIQAFTKAEIASFNEKQISLFTPIQISWFAPVQVPWFTATQIQALTTEQIKQLSKNQMQSLIITQMQSLTKQQIAALTVIQITWFTTQQIPWFTATQIQTFTNKQISWFTAQQISWFTQTQIQALTVTQIVALGTTQIQALKMEQINQLSKTQLDVLQTCIYLIRT